MKKLLLLSALTLALTGCSWLREFVPGTTSDDGDPMSRGEVMAESVEEVAEGLGNGPLAMAALLLAQVLSRSTKPKKGTVV